MMVTFGKNDVQETLLFMIVASVLLANKTLRRILASPFIR